MFIVGFFSGIAFSIVSLFLARFFYWPFGIAKISGVPKEETLSLIKKSKGVKKKPKSISEEELWKREQRESPLDPGL